MKLEEGDKSGRLLMYKRRKSGPRIYPRGTLQTISISLCNVMSGSAIIIIINILFPVGKVILNPCVCKTPDTVHV